MTKIWISVWWFNRQYTKKSRRVKEIMDQRESEFAKLQAKYDELFQACQTMGGTGGMLVGQFGRERLCVWCDARSSLPALEFPHNVGCPAQMEK